MNPEAAQAASPEHPPPNGVHIEQQQYEQEMMTKTTPRRNVVGSIQNFLKTQVQKHNRQVGVAVRCILLVLYFAYFGYCMYYRFGDEGSMRLLVCTVFGCLLILVHLLPATFKARLVSGCTSCCRRSPRFSVIFRWTLYVLVLGFIVLYTGLDMGRKNPRNLMSLCGIAVFILCLYLTSASPANVNWHPVFWGLSIQYIFALLIIRTSWGYEAFDWLGDRVTELLAYSDKGARFVFGDKYTDHIFAMKALPVIVYFSSLISVLYYLGVMQAMIGVVGRFLAFCLNTSPTESLSAAGNIFVGQTEAPLMIRPFMEKMTKSELHAIMTGGFATVSGSVLGSYITFGVKASYLLGASVMAAPCSLALSKLTFPETERNTIDAKEVFNIAKGSANNVIEAASSGASTAIKLVANVAVNVMAFLAILEFLNATLTWFGDRAGIDGLSFEFLCSYLFYPVTFLMGVDSEDCRRVAQLIGYKVFSNEFVAYTELGHLLDNRDTLHNYTTTFGANTTILYDDLDIILPRWNSTRLHGGVLMARSEVIATYSLCGFANLGSMGIQLGGLGAMAPSRRSDLSRLVLRAMITGCIVCFTTACIAGLFFEEH
ncbi:solute carrier family 28 member 3-like isoform X2 [Babylonia areolata]|uniref:solute carrier family 28 member 3-like isoform X2 n=2 Tax=Babylonia areolata TaxID=304850 RepID=UPI003FCF29DF